MTEGLDVGADALNRVEAGGLALAERRAGSWVVPAPAAASDRFPMGIEAAADAGAAVIVPLGGSVNSTVVNLGRTQCAFSVVRVKSLLDTR